MIKFFRKIRQNLLTENKFRKYLIYAIGEIVLVVIGILIALSINNQNEARKDRKFETQALINLKAEFDNHQEYLEYIIGIKEREEEQGRAFLHIISNDTIPISEKLKARSPGSFDVRWSATYSVLNSLLSSGDINKIKNDSLKLSLTNWFIMLESYKGQENRHTEALNQKYKYLNNKRYVSTIKKGDHSENYPGNYYPNNLKKKNDSLKAFYINELEYYNLISQVVRNIYVQIMGAYEISKNYREVSRLIELELKNRNIDLSESNNNEL